MKLELLAATIVLLCNLTTTEGQFKFATNNDSVTITKYTGSGGAVSTNGLIVTAIDNNSAFASTYVSSANIPSTVTNIGSTAFAPCLALQTLTVDTANPVYSSANGALFDKSQQTMLACPTGFGPAGNSRKTKKPFRISLRARIERDSLKRGVLGCFGFPDTFPDSSTRVFEHPQLLNAYESKYRSET